MYIETETVGSPRQQGALDTGLIHPVVMCGGSGTRLWPVSRACMPKQFIELVPGAPTTFQATLARVTDPAVFDHATVITAAEFRHVVAEQTAAGGRRADVILEPEPRDSCAAVAIAALHAARRSPRALVLVMSADHVIKDPSAFAKACSAAAPAAQEGFVVTFGSVPTRPATEFGYILTAEPVGPSADDGPMAMRVARFTEKPDAHRAEALVSDGALWNAGYFLFRADAMIEELRRHAPAVLDAAREALEGAATDPDFVRLAPAAFAKAPKASFDTAVMERTGRAAVLKVDFDWSDVGTWDALWDASPKDGDGNVVSGTARVMDSRNSLVRGDGGVLAAVIGLDDVVVVSTGDAVLVTSRARAGSVKELVSHLRQNAEPSADEHRRMHRPWGWYQRVDIGQRFQVKRIMVNPKGRLSLQKHHHRAEHWVVVHGTAEVTVDGNVTLVHENEAVHLPIGCMHRLSNPGRIPLELIEVQVGSYTGEDDIVRFDDDYGR